MAVVVASLDLLKHVLLLVCVERGIAAQHDVPERSSLLAGGALTRIGGSYMMTPMIHMSALQPYETPSRISGAM